jgi:hypothetical protein
MLDRAARSTVRNFSTLFLICLVVFLPLEIAYATIHQSAIEVRELAPFIEELPGNQRVKGVGPAELDDARRDRMILTAVELALVPLMVSAARRVFERDAAGDLPTATDAYLHSMTPLRLGPLPPADSIGAVGVAVVFSLSVGFATYQAGLLLADVFPDRFDFVLLGAVEACARSLALPWFLGAWVEAGRVKERRRPTTDSPFARPP